MKTVFIIAACLLFLVGCNGDASSSAPPINNAEVESFELTTLENGESSHVKVQHILISFDGALPGKQIRRNQDEAQQLANEILDKALAGADFDELVMNKSDDSHPGIYQLANIDQHVDMSSNDRSKWIMPRTDMVTAFGDVSFGLEVGEIGMAEFNKSASPFGWHIIKRLK